MKKAENYINKRRACISKLLKTAPKGYDDATFHRLRVEIKKVKAFIDVLEVAFPTCRARVMYRPFRQCFKRAGKVRERQLEVSIVKKAVGKDLPKSYLRKLTKQTRKAKDFFFQLIPKRFHKKIKKRFREMLSLLFTIDETTIKNIMDQRKQAIFKLVKQKTFSDRDLHQLRKDLKSLRYVHSALKLNKAIFLHSVFTDSFTDLLGEWHDLVVLVERLNVMIAKGKFGEKEQEITIRRREELASLSKDLHDEIILVLASIQLQPETT